MQNTIKNEKWHFNFSDLTTLKAIARASKELNVPIIAGTSEKEREFVGVDQVVALVKSYREKGAQVFLNADHTKFLEKIKEAVLAGYDYVLFDGSELPLDENIKRTKEVVEWVKSTRPEVIVEGEIGYIGSGSKLLSEVPKGIELTSVEDALRFVQETKVDMLAPAVGNVHGMLTNAPEPKLDIERIAKIKKALRQAQGEAIPLVLHGASGNTDEDIKAAISAGISIVHVNTELRAAWRKALEDSLKNNPKEIAPYNILTSVEEVIREIIIRKLKVFSRYL